MAEQKSVAPVRTPQKSVVPSSVRTQAGTQPARPSEKSASQSATKPPVNPVTAKHSAPTATQLAMAFDGTLEKLHTPIGYRIGIVLVAGVMVLLPLVYLAMIAATCWLVWFHATHSVAMFENVRGRAVIILGVAYVTPLIAGGLVVLFMILPLFWRKEKGPKTMWVDRREQPLLYAYVDRLCDTMRVPRPGRIDLIADANASAHIDNGFFGLFRRRLVLTIGLPLVTTLDLRQFTGVLAHEFGHFAQGGSMRLQYVVQSINRWFARMAFTRTGIDDSLDSMLGDEPHWALAIIGLVSKLALGTARLSLKIMAIISQALAMNLSRQAEFDADRQAARIVGSEAVAGGLELLPFIAAASGAAVDRAQGMWTMRKLPDDLVVLTDHVYRTLPKPAKDKITAEVLMSESTWFDTHPPLFKRMATLKKASWKGVMKLNAKPKILFKDFDELCKLSTIALYQGVLGEQLQPECLVPVSLPKPAAPSTIAMPDPASANAKAALR